MIDAALKDVAYSDLDVISNSVTVVRRVVLVRCFDATGSALVFFPPESNGGCPCSSLRTFGVRGSTSNGG
jgi:hypothetical protein